MLNSNFIVKMLGITVHKMTTLDLTDFIVDAVSNEKSCIIANHNLHSIYIYHHDSKMQAFYGKANYIHIDGMPLVLYGRILGYSLKRENRMTSLDWLPPILSQAAKENWNVFYLGSKPGVAEQGAEILKFRFPKLQITTHHGYFNVNHDSIENQDVVKIINELRPQILLIGMGMPRQEHWIFDNCEQLQTNVIISIGAYIDYIAGVIPIPPRWMGRMGLEWLYRLASEPRRLWRRYLVDPWFLARFILKDIIT